MRFGFLLAVVLTGACLILTAAVPSRAADSEDQSASGEVLAVIEAQTRAWNEGDLEVFTASYAEDTAFVTPSGLTFGREEVLARYRSRYKDKEGMGRLTLEPVRVRAGSEPGSAGTVVVVARWKLEWPDKEPADGLTLIVFERRDDQWLIIEDASM